MGSCSFHPDGNHSSFHPGRNSIRLPPLSTPDVSHPEFCCAAIPPVCFTSGILRPDGRGERFNFPGHTYPDQLIARTQRVSQLLAQCRGVLLKLPDMCDRHFEIFFFRYLMSKSPNSLCNPPIIGFLSY